MLTSICYGDHPIKPVCRWKGKLTLRHLQTDDPLEMIHEDKESIDPRTKHYGTPTGV